jgi:hypothetical protein
MFSPVRRGLYLLNSHGRALVEIDHEPAIRLRDLADRIGLTERATQAVVSDLIDAGYLSKTREGRRNRYTVLKPGEVGRVGSPALRSAENSTNAASGARRAAVLACSDFRFQEPLRALLESEGLLDLSETFLWPGGSAALGGPDGPAILEAMVSAVGPDTPPRVVLVAHQGCHARGAHVGSRSDAFETGRAVLRRRRRGVERARAAFHVEPELWFLSERGAHRLRSRNDPTHEAEVDHRR